ncbi:hypothetical protein [Noviherbaspirillum massiliense]|uniref:hypothetical protein n=1 Tax=Noviherbaspirillum massiliense TaxID=1465823 RepID=UPI0011DDC604|nr:hypothetical protein [Noviherbaspirillum massiliense]
MNEDLGHSIALGFLSSQASSISIKAQINTPAINALVITPSSRIIADTMLSPLSVFQVDSLHHWQEEEY